MRQRFNFVFEVEDQRDWQNACPRNPFSCFFCHLLKVLKVEKVLDLTYGIGGFYEACSHKDITAVDIIQREWKVKPKQFFRMDALQFLRTFDGRADAVVLDPPFPTKPSQRVAERHGYLYEGYMPFHEIITIIKLAKTKARYTILKYMPDAQQFIELLKLQPCFVISWRFVASRFATNEHTVFVRNSTKLFIYC